MRNRIYSYKYKFSAGSRAFNIVSKFSLDRPKGGLVWVRWVKKKKKTVADSHTDAHSVFNLLSASGCRCCCFCCCFSSASALE